MTNNNVFVLPDYKEILTIIDGTTCEVTYYPKHDNDFKEVNPEENVSYFCHTHLNNFDLPDNVDTINVCMAGRRILERINNSFKKANNVHTVNNILNVDFIVKTLKNYFVNEDIPVKTLKKTAGEILKAKGDYGFIPNYYVMARIISKNLYDVDLHDISRKVFEPTGLVSHENEKAFFNKIIKVGVNLENIFYPDYP